MPELSTRGIGPDRLRAFLQQCAGLEHGLRGRVETVDGKQQIVLFVRQKSGNWLGDLLDKAGDWLAADAQRECARDGVLEVLRKAGMPEKILCRLQKEWPAGSIRKEYVSSLLASWSVAQARKNLLHLASSQQELMDMASQEDGGKDARADAVEFSMLAAELARPADMADAMALDFVRLERFMRNTASRAASYPAQQLLPQAAEAARRIRVSWRDCPGFACPPAAMFQRDLAVRLMKRHGHGQADSMAGMAGLFGRCRDFLRHLAGSARQEEPWAVRLHETGCSKQAQEFEQFLQGLVQGAGLPVGGPGVLRFAMQWKTAREDMKSQDMEGREAMWKKSQEEARVENLGGKIAAIKKERSRLQGIVRKMGKSTPGLEKAIKNLQEEITQLQTMQRQALQQARAGLEEQKEALAARRSAARESFPGIEHELALMDDVVDLVLIYRQEQLRQHLLAEAFQAGCAA